MCILLKEQHRLVTSDLQFGFKEKLSATLATAVVTETVDYYLNNEGSVYGLALDATKAFDRVQYEKLFSMLIDRKCNIYLVRLLLNMYENQTLKVRFNSVLSNTFGVSNGVKQGGILSPTLFTCYIDGMLSELQHSKLGCHVGYTYTGCVSYADDLVILAPSLTALKGMIHICENYASKHYIQFNGKKSQLIVFDKKYSHILFV